MSEPTDAEREQQARRAVAAWADAKPVEKPFTLVLAASILRLLDAERARADAAEAKVDAVLEALDLVYADPVREQEPGDWKRGRRYVALQVKDALKL